MSERQKYIDYLKAEIARCEQLTDAEWTSTYNLRTYMAFGVFKIEECAGGYSDVSRLHYMYFGEFADYSQALNACKTVHDKNAEHAKIFDIYSSADKTRVMRDMGYQC